MVDENQVWKMKKWLYALVIYNRTPKHMLSSSLIFIVKSIRDPLGF